ncbi:MAG: hypothetical protein Q4G69_01150 [Planctomycetia bacterium]|nr:hypothetical protein [Planctomycetia bacterium]
MKFSRLLYGLFLLMLFFFTSQDAGSVERAKVKMDKNLYFAYRSFWPEHQTMKRFFDVGVNTVCIFPSSTCNSLGEPYGKYPSIWRYPKSYDWESLEKQFDEIIAINPNVEFLCMVDLNSPTWVARSLAGGGDGNYDSFIDLSNCLSNSEWKKMTMEYMRDFLHHTESKYGNRIKAYILVCGKTDEWMDYSGGRAGRSKENAYSNWRSERGLGKANFASLDQLDTAAFKNIVRDPSTESDALNSVAFIQDLIADSIIEFCKEAKKETGSKKEVGVFFGYIMELNSWQLTGCGHLGYEKVFQSPYIDFMISPGTYADRPMGGGSGFMIANATRLLNGKGFMHEIDHRTTTYNCNLNEFVKIQWMKNWKSPQEDIAGMRREFALALINHSSLWFFDMWGGAHQSEEAIQNIALMKRIWNRLSSDRSRTAAEILLVADPQGIMQINGRGPTPWNTPLRNHLNRIGAPFEICSFNDLNRMDLAQYKMILFPSTFLITPDRAKILEEKVLKDNRTILWMGPAGISDGKTLDPNRVKKWTGSAYDVSEPVKIAQEGWTSYFVRNPDWIQPSLLKKYAKEAGVALYCTEAVPVYANERLIAVHIKEGGQKKISLPRKVKKITEIFTGKTVGENTSSFLYDFQSPETALFEIE